MFRTAFSHDVVEVHDMSTGLYDDGAPNEQLFAILRRNVRFAEKIIGDLRAQVAAGWSGSRALDFVLRARERRVGRRGEQVPRRMRTAG